MTSLEALIHEIGQMGFKKDSIRSFYDLREYRIYFSDGLLVFVKFNNARSGTIVAKSTIDITHGVYTVTNVVRALIA